MATFYNGFVLQSEANVTRAVQELRG